MAGLSGRTSGPPKGMLVPATHVLDGPRTGKSWVAGPTLARVLARPTMTRPAEAASIGQALWPLVYHSERLTQRTVVAARRMLRGDRPLPDQPGQRAGRVSPHPPRHPSGSERQPSRLDRRLHR